MGTPKKNMGKLRNRRSITVWIMIAQDHELIRLSDVLGKSKGDIIGEALQIYINQMYNRGVLKPE